VIQGCPLDNTAKCFEGLVGTNIASVGRASDQLWSQEGQLGAMASAKAPCHQLLLMMAGRALFGTCNVQV
jgi:hypothetical protein